MAILKLIDFKEVGVEFYLNSFFHNGYDYDLMKNIDCDVMVEGNKFYKMFDTVENQKHSITQLGNKYYIMSNHTNENSKRLPLVFFMPNNHDKNGKIYIGFRVSYHSLNNSTLYSNVGMKRKGGTEILNPSPIPNGTEIYWECEFNYATNEYKIYKDNVLIGTAVFNINTTDKIGYVGSNYSGNSRITDIYVVHDKAGDPNPTGRLGPISIESVEISQFINPSSELSVESNKYNTINGETNPVIVVNNSIGWGETINNGVVLENNANPLEARVKASDVDALSDGTIKAIQVTSYTNKDSASESEVTTKIKIGNNELASSKSIPKDLDLDKYYDKENGRIIMENFGPYGAINKTNLKWLQIFNEVKKQP